MAERGFAEASRREIAGIIEKIPAWFVREDRPKSPDELVLAAARRSFLYKRYRRLLEEEGRYWGEAALDLDCRYGSPVVLEDPGVAQLLASRQRPRRRDKPL